MTSKDYLKDCPPSSELPSVVPCKSECTGSTLYPKRFCVGCDETDYMKFPATNMNLCGECLRNLFPKE